MNHKKIFFLLVLLLFIAGCGTKQPTVGNNKEVVTSSTEYAKNMDQRIVAVLAKAQGITEYEYTKVVVDPSQPRDYIVTIYHTPEKQYYKINSEEYYVLPNGTVYQYFKSKITGKVKEVESFIPPKDTLLTELSGITYADLITTQKTIGKYSTIQIVFTDTDGYNVTANVWDYRGVPVLLEKDMITKKVKTEYTNMVVGTVDEKDVTLPADAFE